MRAIEQTAIAEKLRKLREKNLMTQADQRTILDYLEDNELDDVATKQLINRLTELTGEDTRWINIASIPFPHIQRDIFLATLLGDTKLFTELRALPPQPNSRTFLYYKDQDAINQFVQKWNHALNIYFVPNLSDGHGGKKENIRKLTCFFADFDVVKDYEGDYGKVLGIIKGFEHLPSAIIHSGRGLHVYWFLKQHVDVDATAKDTWESVQKGLAQHLGSDPSVTDINNPMRLPDSLNIKDPQNPIPCSVVVMSCATYEFDDFIKYRATATVQQDHGVADIDSGIIREVAEMLVREGLFSAWEANQEMKCFCPYHQEGRNPNLRFSTSKGVFRCFSCGESGTAHKLKEQLTYYGIQQIMKIGRKAS